VVLLTRHGSGSSLYWGCYLWWHWWIRSPDDDWLRADRTHRLVPTCSLSRPRCNPTRRVLNDITTSTGTRPVLRFNRVANHFLIVDCCDIRRTLHGRRRSTGREPGLLRPSGSGGSHSRRYRRVRAGPCGEEDVASPRARLKKRHILLKFSENQGFRSNPIFQN
jgi:hypothetical protein